MLRRELLQTRAFAAGPHKGVRGYDQRYRSIRAGKLCDEKIVATFEAATRSSALVLAGGASLADFLGTPIG